MNSKQTLKVKFTDSVCLQTTKAYAIDLQEGISTTFKASITLLSDKPFTKAQLKNCLKKEVTIDVCQIIEDEITRSRSYVGLVTHFSSKGKIISDAIASQETKATCYCYEIVVEPKAVLLSLNRKTRTFTSKTPIDVIKSILDENNIDCSLNVEDNNIFDMKFENSDYIFVQVEESDLSFINKLCLLFSLNYCFITSKSANSYKCTMVFSRGFTLYPKKSVYKDFELQIDPAISDGLKEEIFSDTALSCSQENKKSHFRINSIKYNSVLSDGSIYDKNNETKLKENVQIQNLGTLVSKLSKRNILEEQKKFLNQAIERLSINTEEKFVARASDLVFSPGVHVKIDSLFKDDPDATDTNIFVISRSSFRFNIDYPSDFAKSSKFSDASNLNQEFIALSVKAQEDEATLGGLNYLPLIFLPSDSSQSISNTSDIVYGINTARVSRRNAGSTRTADSLSAFIGTVCDESGCFDSKVQGGMAIPKNDETAFPTSFLVLLKGSTSPIIVQIVRPLSSGYAVGDFPRIGQKVLVLKVDSQFFFNGFVGPDFSFESYQENLRNDVLKSTKLFHIKPETSGIQDDVESNCISQTNFINFSSYSSAAVVIMSHIMRGSLNTYIKLYGLRKDNSTYLSKLSNYSFDVYDFSTTSSTGTIPTVSLTYDNCSTKIKSNILSCRDALKTAYNELISVENESSNEKELENYKTAKENLDKSYDQLSSFAEKILSYLDKEELTKKDSSDKNNTVILDMSEWSSDGQIAINADKDISINASSAITMASDGSITIKAENAINLVAATGINLKVENSSIGVQPYSINMSTMQIPAAGALPFFESSLNLDSSSGAVLGGNKIFLNAFSMARIKDSFGGSFIIDMGNVNGIGTTANLSTISKLSGVGIIADLASTVLSSLAAIPTDDKNTWGSICKSIGSEASMTTPLIVLWGTLTKPREQTAISKFEGVLELLLRITMVVDSLERMIESYASITCSNTESGWFARNKENNFHSPSDYFHIVTSSATLVLQITAAISSYARQSYSERSALCISSKQIDIVSHCINSKSEKTEVAHSPVASMVAPDNSDNVFLFSVILGLIGVVAPIAGMGFGTTGVSK